MNASHYSDWLPLRVALISCYRGQPGMRAFSYLPPGMTAWLIYRGQAEVTCSDVTTVAKAGQWLIPRLIGRFQRFSADIDFLSLNFFAHWPTGESVFDPGHDIVLEAGEHPSLERKAIEVDELIGTLISPHDFGLYMHELPMQPYIEIQRTFMGFFSALIEALATLGLTPAPPGSIDARLALVLNLIERQPYNQPISLPQLAHAAGLSVVHLNRLAVQHLGKTVLQYCDRRRSEYARRCLLLPGIQVKQVGLNLGFSTAGHFSRWFTQQHGLSPRQFQKQPRVV